MSAEQVATTYIKLLVMDDKKAAYDLLQDRCPYTHKAGFASLSRVTASVAEERSDGVTVSVTMVGIPMNSKGLVGNTSISQTLLLRLLWMDDLWRVECPVALSPPS